MDGLVQVSEILGYLDADRYLTVKHAAKYLDISERALREHLNELPRYKFGNKWLLKKSDVDAWMERLKTTPKRVNVAQVVDDIVKSVI
ncbi:helix-turn-helix domain-containing protein [Acidobacteria bacterium AH-259-O06]|nr:helix-turn-helix domain-containing protein [Acidobacteria bacterium AH-259-O06]